MRVTVSRTSDQFMDCQHPNENWSPHHLATWNAEINDWVVNIKTEEVFYELLKGKGIRLIVTNNETKLPHIEIDDVTIH